MDEKDDTGNAESVFRQLLDAAGEQADNLERVLRDQMPDRARVLAACLRQTFNRLERAATLCMVTVTREWERPRQEIARDLEALRARVAPMLDKAGPVAGDVEIDRFGTRLSLWDPLAAFRYGARGSLDLSGRILTGLSLVSFMQHHVGQGQRFDAERAMAVIAGTDLRRATLEMARLAMAQLTDVDAGGANLDGVIAIEAQLTRASLAGATLRDANLQAVLVSDCDLSGANLTNARWHGGTAIRSLFAGAMLTDLSADQALFLHCDFRGADFSVGALGDRATMSGARFMNCDLRWSHWDHRTLAGATFVGCRFHGVLGAPHVEDVRIDDADLSPDGDRSHVGARDAVVALWTRSTQRRRGITARLDEVVS